VAHAEAGEAEIVGQRRREGGRLAEREQALRVARFARDAALDQVDGGRFAEQVGEMEEVDRDRHVAGAQRVLALQHDVLMLVVADARQDLGEADGRRPIGLAGEAACALQQQIEAEGLGEPSAPERAPRSVAERGPSRPKP